MNLNMLKYQHHKLSKHCKPQAIEKYNNNNNNCYYYHNCYYTNLILMTRTTATAWQVSDKCKLLKQACTETTTTTTITTSIIITTTKMRYFVEQLLLQLGKSVINASYRSKHVQRQQQLSLLLLSLLIPKYVTLLNDNNYYGYYSMSPR